MDKSKCFLSCIFLNLDLHSWEIACFHLENKGNTNTRKNRAEKLNRFPKRWKDKRTAFSKNNKFTMYWIKKKKNFMAPFYRWGSTASRLEPLRGVSLLFTTKFPEIPCTHFINLGRMNSWVNLGATQWFWARDPWTGNSVP